MNDNKFQSILKFVSQVQEAKIQKTDACTFDNVTGLGDLRDDVVRPSLPREVALANAKRHDGKYFVVPLVVE